LYEQTTATLFSPLSLNALPYRDFVSHIVSLSTRHFGGTQAKQEVEDYHEALFRRRAWFPLEEAAQMLTWRPVQHKVLCTYLQARPFIETLLRANTVRESCSEPLDISKFDFTRMQLDCSKDNDNDNSNGTHHPQYSCSFCLSHPTD
jgi:hypothetical protein